MVNVVDIIIKIFAAVGLLALTGVALYYIAKALKKYKPPEKPLWPDERYMEKIGARCPTGWIYTGHDKNGNYLCKNYYHVDVPENGECYDDIKEKNKSFEKINDWKKYQENPDKYLSDRCKWIKKCGPKIKTNNSSNCNAQGKWSDGSEKETSKRAYASWIGVADKC